MERKTDKRYPAVLVIDILAALVLWALLIFLRAVGVVEMHWALVLSSLVWLSWSLFGVTALVCLALYGLVKLGRWCRRRRRDRRVIRQAKAIGVWDGNPIILGGRALELKAWKLFRIKRNPGETDKELRQRCNTANDNEYADTIVKVFDIEAARKKKVKKR